MITQEDWSGTPVYHLQNEQFLAVLCPSIGNNLIRLFDKTRQREVLRRPDHPGLLQAHPGHYGTPLMLPPGRIRHGAFRYGGRSYQLDVNSGAHHIHGFLRSRPWKIESRQEENGVASITSSFHTVDYPEVIEQYPHDVRVEVTYELRGGQLLHQAVFHNRGDRPAPFGYGLHTWFALDGQPAQWTLRAPVSHIWELEPDLITTGRMLPLAPYQDLPSGMKLDETTNLDVVFQADGRPNTVVLGRGDMELRYTASDLFKQWVIYTMGQADQWICLEPYTWVPNAPNLSVPPEQSGLRAVAPGETLQAEVSLEVVHS